MAAQKVSRRQGFALASVRKPEPGALRPGNATAEVVGHLASLAEPSRRQPRLAAVSLTGPLTAGQCLSFARLRDPAKWLVPHQLSGTLWPPPARQTRAVVSLRFPCAALRPAFTGSNIKASSPAQPASVPLQTLQASTSRDWRKGAGGPAKEKLADNPGLLRWPGCQGIAPCCALRKRLVASLLARLEPPQAPVLADRARMRIAAAGAAHKMRRQAGQAGFIGGRRTDERRSARCDGLAVRPPLTLLRRVQASARNAVASCKFVRSVGKRLSLPALTYAPATQLRPCSLGQSSANTPESLSPAGALAMQRFQGYQAAPTAVRSRL